MWTSPNTVIYRSQLTNRDLLKLSRLIKFNSDDELSRGCLAAVSVLFQGVKLHAHGLVPLQRGDRAADHCTQTDKARNNGRAIGEP